MTQLPPEAYPVAVHSSDMRATPDQFRAEASETAIILWMCGGMIGVARTADDTQLQAALASAYAASQAAERFGAQVREELGRRERARQAEPAAAALRAAEHAHPAPPAASMPIEATR